MREFIADGNCIQVQYRDEEATIAFGPEPNGLLVIGHRDDLYKLIIEIDRQFRALNGPFPPEQGCILPAAGVAS